MIASASRFLSVSELSRVGACNSALHDELMSERGCEKIAREHCDSVGARLEWMTWRAFLFALYERAVFMRGMHGPRASAVAVLITQSGKVSAQVVFDAITNDTILDTVTRWVRKRREFRCAIITRNADGVLRASNRASVRMLLRGDVIWWFPEFHDGEREQFRHLCAASGWSTSLMFIWDGTRAVRTPYGAIPAEFTTRGEFSDTYFAHTGAAGLYVKQRAHCCGSSYNSQEHVCLVPIRKLDRVS